MNTLGFVYPIVYVNWYSYPHGWLVSRVGRFLSFFLCLCSYVGKGEVRVLDKKQFEGDSVGEVSGMRSGFPVAGSSVSFVSDIPLHDSDSSLYDSGTLLEVVDNGVDNVSHVSGGCLGWWGCFRLMFVEGRGIGSFMSFGGFIILCVEVVVAVVLFIVLSSVGEVKFDV